MSVALERKFKEVDELYGHKDFKSFEEEFDDEIIYADMGADSVIEAPLEPIDINTDMNLFNVFAYIEMYMFDGWYVALKGI